MNVMLSYRSRDGVFMEELRQHLRTKGIDPWVDRTGILPGTRWRDALLEELRSCDKFVVVLSSNYLESEHCRMEVFIARSFGRDILPVMVDDCFPALRNHEETKGLEDIFMMRMFNLNAVGLPITRDEAFERMSDAVLADRIAAPSPGAVYISYVTRGGQFATELAESLQKRGISTWVATKDIRVGENWRDAQARSMMQAAAHLIVLDEDMLDQMVLRTEILLSEARGLPTYPILPPRLRSKAPEVQQLLDALDHGDQTYRRLAATQYFSCENGVDAAVEQLRAKLSRSV